MKTIPISIHTKHISALSNEYALECALRHAGAGLFVMLVCAYLYFVTASVFHVMGREEALTEVKRLSAATATLEHDFFAKTELITRERGSDLGLVPVARTSYVQTRNTMVDAAVPQTGI